MYIPISCHIFAVVVIFLSLGKASKRDIQNISTQSSISIVGSTVVSHNTSNLPKPTVVNKPDVTRNYFFQSSWPFSSSFSDQPHGILRCNLRPVNWANITSGHVEFLHSSQVKSLFHSFGTYPSLSHSRTLLDGYTRQPSSYDCYILFIYSPHCRFSKSALPAVMALARAYPQLKIYGVQVEDYLVHKWSLRMLFVPKIKIIVGGRIFREYTGSDVNLDEMIDFVWLHIRQLPKGPISVSNLDGYDIPEFTIRSTYTYLILSWVFTILGLIYLMIISNFFRVL